MNVIKCPDYKFAIYDCLAQELLSSLVHIVEFSALVN